MTRGKQGWLGRLAGLGLALLIGSSAARADGDALLTVQPLDAPEIALSMADLKTMGETAVVTATPWTDGQQTFAGVTGRQLMAALKARGLPGAANSIAAVANNDYRIVIPLSAFDQDDTLIAYARNGAPMPVRDKGPLWIVFPFDKDPKYLSTTYKAYAIWGLARLEFKTE